MTSNRMSGPPRREVRTILKASRRKRPDPNVSNEAVSKRVSSCPPKATTAAATRFDKGNCVKNEERTTSSSTSVRNKMARSNKPLPFSKEKGKTSINPLKNPSVSVSTTRLANPDIRANSSNSTFSGVPGLSLNKSYKIPKRPKGVEPLPSLPHGESKTVVTKRVPVIETPRMNDPPNPVTQKGDKIFGEYEEMDWESTVQNIKGLWAGAQFGRDLSIPDVDMEIDSLPERTTEQLVIVPDTNIWIGRLSLIRELLETKFDKFSYPTIIIPWMVLQELDVHGKNPRSSSRPAIHFIYNNLSSNHPRVKGQKASDAITNSSKLDRQNADDSILQCALQCQQDNITVVLLSDDLNLGNKAIVNSVVTAKSHNGVKSILDALQRRSNTTNESHVSAPQIFPSGPIDNAQDNRNAPSILQDKRSREILPTIVKIGDSCDSRKPFKRSHSPPKSSYSKRPDLVVNDTPLSFESVFKLLHETFSHIIEVKMKDEYGDPDWLSVVKIAPPWTLRSAVQCIIKHWMAAFSEVFGRQVSVAEKLLRAISQYEFARDPKCRDDIIECALGMFATGEFAKDAIVKNDSKVLRCRQTLLNYQRATKITSNASRIG